jgi:hypothetical protein
VDSDNSGVGALTEQKLRLDLVLYRGLLSLWYKVVESYSVNQKRLVDRCQFIGIDAESQEDAEKFEKNKTAS